VSASRRARVVAETERLRLQELTADDAAFVRELVNEPAFLRFIGDRHVTTLQDARDYIARGPVASYAAHGFGLWLVALRATGEAAGLCGLVRRDTLPDPDLGFAFLERFRSRGFARESARATLRLARERFGLSRVLAVATPDNAISLRLLESLGFAREGATRLAPEGPELVLLGLALAGAESA